MGIKPIHLLIVAVYVALSAAVYAATPPSAGRLGISLILLGVFLCLFVVFLLRLPANARQVIQIEPDDPPEFDGQHAMDFIVVWITGCLFVFGGVYWMLSTVADHPLPANWWVSIVPALALMSLYFPVWKYWRTL